MAKARRIDAKPQAHQWLSSVAMTGLFLSEPVLNREFPDGPAALDNYLASRFRIEYERFSIYRGRDLQDAQSRWVSFILERLLNIEPSLWRKSDHIPESATVKLSDYAQVLRPSRVIEQEGRVTFLVLVGDSDQELQRPDRTQGRWKASPFTKMDKMLRETGVRLGLLTNGHDWRVMYAEPGLNTAFVDWSSQGWNDERATLNAFRMLLGKERLFADSGKRQLLDLIKESQERQIEVADQLGLQVREAIEIFVHALDEADQQHNGDLLAGFTTDEIYEMSIVVMMRLVFLLYAEENGLLPHGEVLYDQAYGVNHLAYTLQQTALSSPASLKLQRDAWPTLLATFRLIHGGCRFPELNLRAYGGNLFDPNRFTALGRHVSVLEEPRLALTNRTIHEILHKLTYASENAGRDGVKQRVSYNTVDVEQIGYMYEGLLDHTVVRADDVAIKLNGKGSPVVGLKELESHRGSALVKWLGKLSDKNKDKIKQELEAAPDLEASAKLIGLVGHECYERLLPYAGLIDLDFVVLPNRLYVGLGQTRRATGSHYTRQVLTAPIVQNTLNPLVYEDPDAKTGLRTPKEILDLKVADIAMGSGAFLVQAVRHLAERLVESWDSVEDKNPGIPITPFGELSKAEDNEAILPIDPQERLLVAKRLIVDRCIYGVDINPLAVEMSKLSLWILTFSKDKPFTFLDHALKVGDSLLGIGLEQLQHWSLTKSAKSTHISASKIDSELKQAVKLRRELQETSVDDVEDAAYKALKLIETERLIESLKVAGDLIISPAIVSSQKLAQDELNDSNRHAYIGTTVEKPDVVHLKKLAKSQLGEHRPFHWPVEFPEVFLRDNGGYDAIVGNPPFKGSQRLRGIVGTNYRNYLVHVLAGDIRGIADLCAYFFLRSFALLRTNGNLGLLATNTIAQGGTRAVGLDTIARLGGDIFNAVRSMAWPGVAAVHIAKVHVHKGRYGYTRQLDDEIVTHISSRLTSSHREIDLRELNANTNKSFIGSYLLSTGFIIPPEIAQTICQNDSNYKKVIMRHINGDDLNQTLNQQPQRWVINFHDWPLRRASDEEWKAADEKRRRAMLAEGICPADYMGRVAADFPECLRIVEEKVRPQRMTDNRKVYRLRWWQYAEKRPELYNTIKDLGRVLVRAQVSKTWAFHFLPLGWVYDAKLVVFALNQYWEFSQMQGLFHECWTYDDMTTFKGDLSYAPRKNFRTFPFADYTDALEDAGKTYYEHRQGILATRTQGLTDTYNRFHNPADREQDIKALRQLQVAMDKAVAEAYGWRDLSQNHDFFVVSSMLDKDGKRVDEIRYTVAPAVREEILRRLLELNHQRYSDEVSKGLHGKKKAGEVKQPKPRKHKAPLSTNQDKFL